MKIAILHEMFIKLGWAEKVVEVFYNMFPEAPIFSLIYDEKKVGKVFPKEKIDPQVFKLKSQKIYNLTKKQRFCLPFMASSVEKLDFSEYDVVLCSSSGFAHWAITKPETKFIVYYHSPARYMWDWTNEYKRDLWLNSGFKKYFLSPFINSLFLKNRIWDFIASKRVDINLANSKNTLSRIKKYYKKDAEVLYPPVETERFWTPIPNPFPSKEKGETKKYPPLGGGIKGGVKNYYIIISALTEFKKIDVAIKAFNNLKENLVIVWAWDYKWELEKMIVWENIKLIWAKYGDELVSLVQNSLWMIFPWEEDFWIVPIEVMAAWKPVFAYNSWWLTETVLAWVTWEFFDDKTWLDFIEKFKKFHKNNLKWKYSEKDCKKRAKKFDKRLFEEKIREIIKK